MTKTTRRRVTVATYATVLVLVTLAAMTFASAATGEVTVPISNIVRGDPGDIKPARDPVATASLGIQVGQECLVELIGENPGSEHPVDGDGAGNDLILSTNGQSLVAPNFEETRGKITAVSAVMIMGEFVTFDVLLGEDGVSSGGLTATFDCLPPTTTTTTVPPTTTTTTTVPPTTTTTVPPTTTTLPPTTTTTIEDWPTTTTTTRPISETTTTMVPESTTSTTIETPEGGVPAGGGACVDGCCICIPALVWPSWTTWLAWFIVGAGLALVALSGLTLWRVWRR